MRPELDLTVFNSNLSDVFESDWLEFKQNISEGIAKNIQESICAFLNRNGGYIIVGVSDNLEIVGVDLTLYDNFINNTLDSIYHQALIIYGDTGNIINPFLIKAYKHQNSQGKNLIIFDVKTDLCEITEGYRSFYRLKNGTSFFRLNCSNLKSCYSTRLYQFNEIHSTQITALKNDINRISKSNEKIKNKYSELNRDYSDIEAENERLKRRIKRLGGTYSDIVEDKKNSESYCLINMLKNCFGIF